MKFSNNLCSHEPWTHNSALYDFSCSLTVSHALWSWNLYIYSILSTVRAINISLACHFHVGSRCGRTVEIHVPHTAGASLHESRLQCHSHSCITAKSAGGHYTDWIWRVRWMEEAVFPTDLLLLDCVSLQTMCKWMIWTSAGTLLKYKMRRAAKMLLYYVQHQQMDMTPDENDACVQVVALEMFGW